MKIRFKNQRYLLILGVSIFLFYNIFTKRKKTSQVLNIDHKSETFQKLFNYSSIPKIIHQSWKTKQITSYTKQYVEKCMNLNKDYIYMFWDDEDIRKLVTKQFSYLLPIFDSYYGFGEAISKADLSRVLIIYLFGGVYMDLDVECLTPLESLLNRHDCILAQEPWGNPIADNREGIPFVSNFFLAAKPHHKFLRRLVDEFPHSFLLDDVVERTGPGLFTKVYHSYKLQTYDNLPYIPDSEVFGNKIGDEEMLINRCKDLDYMKKFSEKNHNPPLQELMKYCSNYKTTKSNSTKHMTHHFIHTWIDKEKFDYSDTFDVEDLARDIGITYVTPDIYI